MYSCWISCCYCLMNEPFSQAQARCHRIGQNKAVKVYRLITRNSYEREMFDRASLKLGLDKAVLQSMSGRENSVGGVCTRLLFFFHLTCISHMEFKRCSAFFCGRVIRFYELFWGHLRIEKSGVLKTKV